LTDLQKYALVFSGLCHDINHTAHSNLFEVNSLSKLATRFSDSSVLERHHIATTFKVINMNSCNIFENINVDEMKKMRKYIIANILATDVKIHFDLMQKFETKFFSPYEGD